MKNLKNVLLTSGIVAGLIAAPAAFADPNFDPNQAVKELEAGVQSCPTPARITELKKELSEERLSTLSRIEELAQYVKDNRGSYKATDWVAESLLKLVSTFKSGDMESLRETKRSFLFPQDRNRSMLDEAAKKAAANGSITILVATKKSPGYYELDSDLTHFAWVTNHAFSANYSQYATASEIFDAIKSKFNAYAQEGLIDAIIERTDLKADQILIRSTLGVKVSDSELLEETFAPAIKQYREDIVLAEVIKKTALRNDLELGYRLASTLQFNRDQMVKLNICEGQVQRAQVNLNKLKETNAQSAFNEGMNAVGEANDTFMTTGFKASDE